MRQQCSTHIHLYLCDVLIPVESFVYQQCPPHRQMTEYWWLHYTDGQPSGSVLTCTDLHTHEDCRSDICDYWLYIDPHVFCAHSQLWNILLLSTHASISAFWMHIHKEHLTASLYFQVSQSEWSWLNDLRKPDQWNISVTLNQLNVARKLISGTQETYNTQDPTLLTASVREQQH